MMKFSTALLLCLASGNAFAQAGISVTPGTTATGTIGTNKGSIGAVQCPSGTLLSGARHVDRSMSAATFPVANGMTTQLGLYCSTVSTDGSTITVQQTTANGTPAVPGFAYLDPGTVRNGYCPAGWVAHRMGGWDRATSADPWPSAVRLVCRPLQLNANSWVRVNTASSSNSDAGVLEANATHNFRGPFCSDTTQTSMVSGYHRQAGGLGYDGINIYCGGLIQARFSSVLTFTDFAWSQVLGGSGWLVNLRQGAATLNDGGGNNGAGRTPHASVAANTNVFQAGREIYVLPASNYNAQISQRPAAIAANTFITSGTCLGTGIALANEQDAACTLAVQGLSDIAIGISTPAPAYQFHGQQQNVVMTATNRGPGATDGDDGFTAVMTLPAGWTAGTLPSNCAASGGGTVVTCALNPTSLAGSSAPGTNGGSVSFTIPVLVNAPTGTGTYTATASLGRAVPDGDADPSNNDFNTGNDGATGALVFQAQADFGTCDARMFLDQVNSDGTLVTLYNVGYPTSPFTFSELGTSPLARNGIGYNPVDNYIYGIEWGAFSGNELIRVGADGSSANLGTITGLPVSNYNNGVISPSGDYYLMSGFGGNTLYRVDITARTATVITLSQTLTVSDFAWHDNALYAIDSTLGRLVRVDPASGTVTLLGLTTPISNAIAIWGFANGLLATTGGSIYAIDPATGATILASTAPAATNADGANCPGASIELDADLSVTKTNTPASGPNDLADDTYLPGEVRTYRVVVSNASNAFGAMNVTVSDPVPAGINAGSVSWTCTSTSGGARCGATNGTGGLNDGGLDLPPGAVATYLVTMTVPTTFTGNLTNTVTITPPSNINETDASNNTATDTDQQNTQVSLWVRKTNTPTIGPDDQPDDVVVGGSQVPYELRIGNDGPASVLDARLADILVEGLSDCELATTACEVLAGAALCPATGSGAGQLSVANLLGSGVVIPRLTAGSSLVVRMICNVD